LTIDQDDLEKQREKMNREREKEASLKEAINEIKDESRIFERIVSQLVDEFCEDIDLFSQELDRLIKDIKRGKVTKYSQLKLEMRCLELANGMYKATEGLAIMGSRSDVAKAQKKDMFNKAYRKTREGTIPDKTAEAENEILQEILIEKIMDRAYTVISQKVKSANRTLEAIKKVLTSRMIHKEVFRKEAPVMDRIDSEDLTDDMSDIDTGLEDDI
jgi:hypothetical protein